MPASIPSPASRCSLKRTGHPASGRAVAISSPEIRGPSTAGGSIFTSDPHAVTAAVTIASRSATPALLLPTPWTITMDPSLPGGRRRVGSRGRRAPGRGRTRFGTWLLTSASTAAVPRSGGPTRRTRPREERGGCCRRARAGSESTETAPGRLDRREREPSIPRGAGRDRWPLRPR